MTIYQLIMHCPDFQAQVDAQQMREALTSSPGCGYVEFDLPMRTVTVTTANSDGGHDVIRCLAHAGYPPDDTEVESYGRKPG